MRLNESTVIIGKRCALVPYHPKHVPKYHGWMQDPLLRHQTGSEELTLEEEFDMQAAWRNDEDKLTFIIVSPNYEKDEVNTRLNSIHNQLDLGCCNGWRHQRFLFGGRSRALSDGRRARFPRSRHSQRGNPADDAVRRRPAPPFRLHR